MDCLGHEDPSAKGGNVCSDTYTVFKEEELETQPHNDSNVARINVAEMLKVSASLMWVIPQTNLVGLLSKWLNFDLKDGHWNHQEALATA